MIHPSFSSGSLGHLVLAAFRHDQVGVALRGLHELEVHGPHRVEVLAAHRLEGAPAVADVALQAAEDAHVGVGVDEELDVHHPTERVFGQDQDALEEQHRSRGEGIGQHLARVGGVVVDEMGDRTAGLQVTEILHEERGVESVGVVVVDGGPGGGIEGGAVLVVRVLGDEQAALGAEARQELPGEAGLARACAPRHPDEDRHERGL